MVLVFKRNIAEKISMKVKIISLFEKETDPNGVYVNTTSRAESSWQRDLSPFYLGPCKLYWDLEALVMENAWQYSKVYAEYDNEGEPKEEYFDWAYAGWNNPRANRYPMGKGKKPLYSWWDGIKMGYVDARRRVYIPLYANAVVKTAGYRKLEEIYNSSLDKTLYLKDYDAYRHEDLNMTLEDVVNNPNKKCGHAFILAILLTREPLIRECKLPLSM